MIMRKKFVTSYMFSFVVGFVFGELLDFYEWWIKILPYTIPMRIVYFILGRIKGLGIGTILAAFTMGKGIALIGGLIDKKFVFENFLTLRKKAQA